MSKGVKGLIGNFDFMLDDERIDTYPELIYTPCAKAEYYYAMGDYPTAIGQCRTALDSIVEWMYASDDFPDLPNAYAVTLDDRIHHPAFGKVLHDSWLLNKLDNVRLSGNAAIHNKSGDFSASNALGCLQSIHALMLNIEQQLWEYPVKASFFEPVYEPEPVQPEDPEPAYRDIPALLTESLAAGDHENAAKYALLLYDADPSIPIAEYAEALPRHTAIRDLIGMLTNQRMLTARVDAGPYVVNSLVSKCYGDFPWWEKDIIIKLCTNTCRRFVEDAEKQIESMLQMLTAIE